jgi:hypothetical protein
VIFTPPRYDGFPPLFIILRHTAQAFLGCHISLECLARAFDARALECVEDYAIGSLLLRIVLCKKRALVLAVCTLDVVDPLCSTTQTLIELLLFTLELLDLHAHERIRRQILHFL